MKREQPIPKSDPPPTHLGSAKTIGQLRKLLEPFQDERPIEGYTTAYEVQVYVRDERVVI